MVSEFGEEKRTREPTGGMFKRYAFNTFSSVRDLYLLPVGPQLRGGSVDFRTRWSDSEIFRILLHGGGRDP